MQSLVDGEDICVRTWVMLHSEVYLLNLRHPVFLFYGKCNFFMASARPSILATLEVHLARCLTQVL